MLRLSRRRDRSPAPAPPAAADGDDLALLARLRAGDEAAFTALVDRYHPTMVRVARSYVPSDAVAEEVAQEAWLGALKGLDRFEGRSSLRTWLFRILVNQAKTHGARERRMVAESLTPEAAVDPERFVGGAWDRPPSGWSQAEERLLARETRAVVATAIQELPHAQQLVISLRDIDGLGSAEVCELLELSEGNQRVLLHRARSRVRRSLEHYMGEEG